MPHRLKITPEGMQALLERLYARSIIADDYELIIAIVEAHVLVDDTLKEKQGTIMKLLRMLFGAKTEKKKTDHVVKPNTPKEKSKGHGRNGRASYTGSKKVTVAHPVLKSGDPCPECHKGRVYPGRPSVLVRITGGAPLAATSWELEKLRCNLCGEVFTPELPESAGEAKYHATAGAMVALLKYGSGLPFNRLEQLQESMGVPLPASTQWDIVEKCADRIHPLYRELTRQAACEGSLIHN